jgi:hypothetical protein
VAGRWTDGWETYGWKTCELTLNIDPSPWSNALGEELWMDMDENLMDWLLNTHPNPWSKSWGEIMSGMMRTFGFDSLNTQTNLVKIFESNEWELCEFTHGHPFIKVFGENHKWKWMSNRELTFEHQPESLIKILLVEMCMEWMRTCGASFEHWS